MTQIAFGTVLAATLAATGIVSAADLGRQPAPGYKAPPPAQAFSWTGCYVGGNAGGIFNKSDVTANPNGDTGFGIAATPFNLDNTDFTAGASWGCNWGSWNNFVAGIDSDFNWSGLSESATAAYATAGGRAAYNQTITQDLTWFATTRLRVGYAFADRWMVFASGGLARGKVKSSYLDLDAADGSYIGSTSETRWGWTVGGGLEYALSQDWFLRGEYMYIDLGDHDYASLNNGVVPGTWNTDVHTKAHVVRGALTYRFTTSPDLLKWATNGFRY